MKERRKKTNLFKTASSLCYATRSSHLFLSVHRMNGREYYALEERNNNEKKKKEPTKSR